MNRVDRIVSKETSDPDNVKAVVFLDIVGAD